MRRLTRILAVGMLCTFPLAAYAQTDSLRASWTLSDCIRYALENNIQLRQSHNNYLSTQEDLLEARAARFPTVSASSSQGMTYTPATGKAPVYNGSYNIGASMTLYSGGRLRNAVRQKELSVEADSLSLLQAEDEMRISIIQSFIQCLYATDNVEVARSTVTASQTQRDRAEELFKAGTISKVDLAQLESQLSSDKYKFITARTSLDNYRLQLRQLLELEMGEEMVLDGAGLGDEDVLQRLPPREEVYAAALDYLPDMRISDLNIRMAELSEKTAKAGYIPSISASVGLGTGTRTGTEVGFGDQFWNNFNQNAGLSLQIPIYSTRKNKTAVNKARLALENSKLSALNTQKQILREVESTWLDAVSAQAQYMSAVEKTGYSRQSYELTLEQFNVGMKNTVELITAQNEYTAARQSELQAKYVALMSRMILDVYQGKFQL